MSEFYALDADRKVIKCADVIEWGNWFQKCNRHVAVEKIGEVKISTIFLGIDHSFGEGAPILWETMVFGGPLDQEQDRCGGNWRDAEIMHAAMVRKVKEGAE